VPSTSTCPVAAEKLQFGWSTVPVDQLVDGAVGVRRLFSYTLLSQGSGSIWDGRNRCPHNSEETRSSPGFTVADEEKLPQSDGLTSLPLLVRFALVDEPSGTGLASILGRVLALGSVGAAAGASGGWTLVR
jgi:hypothetical protein